MRVFRGFKTFLFLVFAAAAAIPSAARAQSLPIFYCTVTLKSVSPANNATIMGNIRTTISVTINYGSGCRIPTVQSCTYSMTGGFADKTYTSTNGNYDTALMETGFYSSRVSCTYTGGRTVTGTATYKLVRDNINPTVSITNLYENQEVYGDVIVKANASDTNTGNSELTDVKFYAGSTLIGTDPTSPYQAGFDSRNFPDGSLAITARATDSQGNQADDIVILNLNNGNDPPDPGNPPVVTFQAPLAGSTISGQYTVRVAVQFDGTLQRQEFYVGGTLHANVPVSQRTISLDTTQYPDGIYTLSFLAVDSAGRSGDANVPITIRNQDTESPTVLITAPPEGSVQNGIVRVAATASDNVAVSKVDMYLDTTLLASINLPPYELDLDTRSLPDGQYQLRAVAFDNGGSTADHAITVTFNNSAPDPTPTPTRTPANTATPTVTPSNTPPPNSTPTPPPVPTATPGPNVSTPVVPPLPPIPTVPPKKTPTIKKNQAMFQVTAINKVTKARIAKAQITFVSGTKYKKVKADKDGVARWIGTKGSEIVAVVKAAGYIETASNTYRLKKNKSVTIKVPPAGGGS